MSADFIAEFRAAMREAGIDYSGPIQADHENHRFTPDGDHSNSGWYTLHPDGPIQAGSFGCWRRGISQKWHVKNGGVDPQTLAECQAKWAAEKRQREVAKAERYERRSVEAVAFLSNLPKAEEHFYLVTKGVPALGALLQSEDRLILPLQDPSGKVWSYQSIGVMGEKLFMPGGRVEGCFFLIDGDMGRPLYICEGYATGATVHQASGGAPVVCVMNCGNLERVCRELAVVFKNHRRIIAGDDDRYTIIRGEPANPGRDKAVEVAAKTGCEVIFPEFPDTSERKGTDFNDMAAECGMAEVARVLSLAPKALVQAEVESVHDPLPGNEEPFGPPEDQLRPLPAIVDACGFVAEPIPEPKSLIEGLVHMGTKVIVGGGSKSFKTWVQLDAALSVATGTPWLDFPTCQGRVLFVNFEIQPAFFQRRILAICKARGIKLQPGMLDVWNLRGHSAAYGLLIPQIITRIKALGYALIVLDPIYKLYGSANENDASEVAQLLNSLERVCVETGAAVMFGAHYSKGNQAAKESIDRISGSGVFARDPDSIIPFTRHEEEGSFVIEPTLRNLPPIDPFVVTWNHPLMERNLLLDPAELKQAAGRPKQHSAADLLACLPDSGLEVQEWERASGMKRATFFRLKAELKAADRILYSRVNDCWKPVRK